LNISGEGCDKKHFVEKEKKKIVETEREKKRNRYKKRKLKRSGGREENIYKKV
jgi:hypothetical protein